MNVKAAPHQADTAGSMGGRSHVATEPAGSRHRFHIHTLATSGSSCAARGPIIHNTSGDSRQRQRNSSKTACTLKGLRINLRV